MNNRICKYCEASVNRKKPGIQCSGTCARFVHGECVNIVGQSLDAIRMKGVEWKCEECRTIGVTDVITPRASMGGPGVSTATTSILSSIAYPADMVSAVKDMQEQLKRVLDQQKALMESANFCCAKITDFEQKLTKFEEYMKKTDKLVAENKKLTSNVQSLTDRLNDLEQMSRSHNLEIQGVPEKNSENLLQVLEKIGNYINYEINPSTVEYIHRVQPNKNSNNTIKNIIVRFSSSREKENILTAAKTKRLQRENGSPKMKIDGLSDNLYINEHLTLSNKILYREVRIAAKSKNYKFHWTKNGSIFVRKNETSRVLLIKNTDAIKTM